MRNAVVIMALAALGAGCRMNPCGDHSATLPASFDNAPIVADDGHICHASDDHAQIEYWGDDKRMREVLLQTELKMKEAGYRGGPPAEYDSPTMPALDFTKGDQVISLRFSLTETPRLGSQLKQPSISAPVMSASISAASTA